MAKDAKGHGSDPRGGAIAKAQAEANRSGKPMSVLNLNTVGQAMHVVRDYDPGHETGRYAHQFVAKVNPQLSDTQAANELGQGHPKSEPVPVHSGAMGPSGLDPANSSEERARIYGQRLRSSGAGGYRHDLDQTGKVGPFHDSKGRPLYKKGSVL